MSKPNFILFILLLLLPAISRAQKREPVEQVKSLMESCQFSQAANLAEQYLLQDSTLTDMLLLKGLALAAGFQYREAILAFRKALSVDSTNIKVLNELVNVYRQSGDPVKAIAIGWKIAGLVPENRYFRLQLANLYYSVEDYRHAVQVLLPLYKADSSSFYVAKQIGNCFNELKRSDSAVYFYRRALKITPYDPLVTGKLINLYVRQDEVAHALYMTQVYLVLTDIEVDEFTRY